MAQKIVVKAECSQDKRTFIYNIEDLGIRKSEWDKADDEKRKMWVQQALDDEAEQPNWAVATFSEKS